MTTRGGTDAEACVASLFDGAAEPEGLWLVLWPTVGKAWQMMNEEIDDDDLEEPWDEEIDYGPIDAMLTAAREASSKEAAVCAAIEVLIGLDGSFGLPTASGGAWHPTAELFRKMWETPPTERYGMAPPAPSGEPCPEAVTGGGAEHDAVLTRKKR